MKSLESLYTEHRTIEQMLIVLEAIAKRLEQGGDVPPSLISDVIDFFHDFADALHHAKEERRLFPVLAGHGLGPEASIVGALVHQHDAGRVYVREMRAELERLCDGDLLVAAGLAASARAYVELLREHIRIEDEYLYPLAQKAITSEEDAMLCSEFSELERTHHEPGQRSRYDQLLARYLEVASEWLTGPTAGSVPAAAADPHTPPARATTTVLDNWAGKSLDQVLGDLRDLLEDPEYPTLKRWREAGGKVLGHFQVYFPEEIAHAAGMLPLKMHGAQIEARQAEARFGSYLCSIIKTSLELALSGRVGLDLFVTHPICDAARNLAAVWGRNFSYPCEILYLPQNANSSHAVEYLRHEYDRVRRTIQDVSGVEVTDGALRHSIAVFNENRRLLRALYDIKRQRPWLLPVDEAYVLMAAGGCIPREEHNALLRAMLPQIEARRARAQDRLRVVFEGGFCEQPPLDLLRTIGQSCYVVDDDLMIGLRWITKDVATAGDPLHNLAEAYIERSTYSPVQHDLRKPKEQMLLDRIRHSGAGAAIITAAKMCEPGLDEQVAYSKALDEARIPYFVSEFEESMTSFEHLEIQLETFVENVLFP
jgi:benzoyl-CoA reductase subunit C